MQNLTIIIVGILGGAALLAGFVLVMRRQQQRKSAANLRSALARSNWELYAMTSCPHCVHQKEELDWSREKKDLIVVQCDKTPTNPTCLWLEKQNSGIPAWIHKTPLGEIDRWLTGFRSADVLKSMAKDPLKDPGKPFVQ